MQQVSEPWGCAGTINGDAYHHFGAGCVAGIAGTDEKKQKWASSSFGMTMQVPTGLEYRKRKSKEERFKVLEWPSQSLDLNLIEN